MNRLRPLLALGLALALGACASLPVTNLLDSANAAQNAAAQTYDQAKAQEASMATACRMALVSKGLPLPVTAAATGTACTAVGVPLPFDPVKLQQASVPINALFDGIRAANDIRSKLAKGASMPATVLIDLGGLIAAVVADLTAGGVTLPPSVTTIAGQLQAATGGAK
jgi:glucose/arabinose dehydrogenase